MTTQPRSSPAVAQVGGDWRHRAACRDVDPEIFYPTAQAGPVFVREVAAAKAVCAGCPVRAQCLAFAVTELPDGIAGGLTPDERRTHRAQGSRQVAPSCGRLAGGTAREVAEAGRAAIRSGRAVRDVAREFGVTDRTAARWAAPPTAPATTGDRVGGEEPRLAPGSSPDLPQPHTPLAGTATMEGHRS